MRLVDLADESVLGISIKTSRLILTMMGTVVGIAALVATLGLGQTASGQITQRFDEAAATRIVVKPNNPQGMEGQEGAFVMPWNAADRVLELNGVAAAGTYSTVTTGKDKVSGVVLNDPAGANLLEIPVIAGSSGLLEAESGVVTDGRFFDSGHDERADRVVVLGSRAALKLAINRVSSRPSIFIGETPFAVIGIFDDVVRRDDLLDAVIIPNGTAANLYALSGPQELDIRTVVGAAQQVGKQAAVAVSPNRPESVRVNVPPAPGRLGNNVLGDVNALFLAFGAVALVVGGLGIANVTLLSVMERTGEIGLRRALGARKRHIAGQFLLESMITGLLGGLIGAALGVAAVVAVSATRDWTPILDLQIALLAPVLGSLIGLLAGAYPAIKAATIEPITALRRAS
ncbi:ABC transporter permease [Nakamurella antarctica]|uniref:ABC transporter permease n=2 Tax=Nakamurella antarctica TaxID=1902245 RepID=A0A3G8ZQU9_9ACTN|nr:ABC transporter permease [Nakamurella antarctica]